MCPAVSENAGFSWDPNARYGPETIAAMPAVDNHLKEALFDESVDQKFDGIPGTGFEHFGGRGSAGAGVRSLSGAP